MAENNGKLKSVIWSAVERLSVQGVSFALSLIIARLVLPSEFGLIAMLSIFISIAQTFVDSGFSNALIQKQNRSEVDFSTVFYFNIIVGIFFYILLYICAPLIAEFYHEPLLVSVTRWVALSFVLSSFSVVQRAKLTIAHDFKSQAIASFIAVLISGVLGVYFAYKGWGVWALVIQTLTNQLLISLLLWLIARWIPAFVFSKNSFKTLFNFGSKLLLSGLLNTVYTNIYTIIIGRIYSAQSLGFYSKANMLSQFSVVSLANILHRAIYPYQCEMQNDNERLHELYMRYLRLSAFLSFPIMFGILTLANSFVIVVLTDKWLPCVPMIRILCIAYMFYIVSYVNCQMLNVKGRSDLFLRAEIFKKIIAVVLLLLALPFGVEALCWSMAVYGIIDLFIIVPFVKKIINTNLSEVVRLLIPSLLVSVITSVITYIAISFISQVILQLVGGAIIYIFIFAFVSYILKLNIGVR